MTRKNNNAYILILLISPSDSWRAHISPEEDRNFPLKIVRYQDVFVLQK